MYNAVRYKLMDEFQSIHKDKAVFTYGYITAIRRRELGLKKEHYNNAIAIAGMTEIKNNDVPVTVIKQVRKKKRSLHEATARKGRNMPNVKQIRNSKNTKEIIVNGSKYSLWDKVGINGNIGYISGFTGKSCYIQDIDGNYIKADGKSYKQISISKVRMIGRNNNWITERKAA